MQVEPGLGESDFFYSALMTIFNTTAAVAAIISGILVKCVPFWYQYICFISFLVLGSVLYGISNNGWVLGIGIAIIGLFLGAEGSLGNNYANQASKKYVKTLKETGESIWNADEKAVKIRNYLYTAHTFGHGIGFIIGTGM